MVLLVHVCHLSTNTTLSTVGRSDSRLGRTRKHEIQDSKELLKELGKLTRLSKHIEIVTMHGNPREELERAIKDFKLDRVVVGSRGLGFKKKWFGSVYQVSLLVSSKNVLYLVLVYKVATGQLVR